MPAQTFSPVSVLVLGGVANLALSFLLGWVLSAVRMKRPMASAKWLLTAHEVSLQEGLMLLGIAVAMGYSDLDTSWGFAAAWLLVAASAFQDASGIANWLRHTDDQFAERSFGWVLASINAVLNTTGLAIVVYGVCLGVL